MYKEGDLVYHKTLFDANTHANVIASDFHISNANARKLRYASAVAVFFQDFRR